MRKIIVITQLSLDGVMQAPGGPDEDLASGFTLGGWAMPFGDEVIRQALNETVAGPFDLLLGRRTYDIFAGYWPQQGADDRIGKLFNSVTKYVATHGNQKLDWENSQSLGSDVVAALRDL